MDLNKYKNLDVFDIPETPDELELLIGWAFDRIRIIVSRENHYLKFDGPQQILDILEIAALREGVVISFSYIDGQWFISDAGSKEDILALPKVIRRFARIYRHNAGDYVSDEPEFLRIKDIFTESE